MLNFVSGVEAIEDIIAKGWKPSPRYWLEVSRVARRLKAAAADAKERDLLWSAHTFGEATRLYLEAFRLLSRGRYLEGWCRLEEAEIGFKQLVRNSFAPGLVYLIEDRVDLVELWQSIFPYRHFASPAMRLKRWECSICGKQSTPIEPCGHMPNQVYAGELCYRRILDFEALEVSIVTDPVQKYSVLQLDYDYSVVRYVLDHLSGPFHQWTGEWTHKRHGHDKFSDRAPTGSCPCESGLRYGECCLFSKGVRLPHFQMSVTIGTRVGPLADVLVVRRPGNEHVKGESRVFNVNLLKASR